MTHDERKRIVRNQKDLINQVDKLVRQGNNYKDKKIKERLMDFDEASKKL